MNKKKKRIEVNMKIKINKQLTIKEGQKIPDGCSNFFGVKFGV